MHVVELVVNVHGKEWIRLQWCGIGLRFKCIKWTQIAPPCMARNGVCVKPTARCYVIGLGPLFCVLKCIQGLQFHPTLGLQA